MGFLDQIEIQRWVEYLEALEEERKKIEVFRRELPLCLELVTHTIESCRQQLMVSDDEICGAVPLLEEFRSLTPEGEVEEERSHENQNTSDDDEEEEEKEQHNKDQEKSDWLKSVQLSVQQPNRSDEEDGESKLKKPIAIDLKKTTGAFHPFHRDRKLAPAVETPPPPPPQRPVAAGSSTADTSSGGRGNNDKSQGQQSLGKTRRCWSPELHRRFLRALHELGGSHVATPKQIRELMVVDGLTNDEVKSHLQKYRLHTRRPSQVVNVTGNGASRPPAQFILVGGIWVPPQPPEFATTVLSRPVTDDNSAAAAPTTKIYTPVASLPIISTQCNMIDKNGFIGEGDRANSSSPATSNSSLTNTTSPAKIIV